MRFADDAGENVVNSTIYPLRLRILDEDGRRLVVPTVPATEPPPVGDGTAGEVISHFNSIDLIQPQGTVNIFRGSYGLPGQKS